MNLDYRNLLPADFSGDSRVWIYQSNRLFTLQEVLEIEDVINAFVENWKSHGSPVAGFASVFFGQFIVLMADESGTQVGGCSTDSSVKMIKWIETRFKVSLFDRQALAFVLKDRVELLPYTQLAYAVENGLIDADTLYFNNTVQIKAEWENNWIIPVKQSWLKNRAVFSQLSDS